MVEPNEPRNRAPAEPEETLGDIVDRAGRRIATGLVAAGIVVSLGIYWRPAPPRYDAFAAGSHVVRVDTRTGNMIACDGQRCVSLHRKGQNVDRRAGRPLLAAPAPPATLPAASGRPAAPAAPAAPEAPARP